MFLDLRRQTGHLNEFQATKIQTCIGAICFEITAFGSITKIPMRKGSNILSWNKILRNLKSLSGADLFRAVNFKSKLPFDKILTMMYFIIVIINPAT